MYIINKNDIIDIHVHSCGIDTYNLLNNSYPTTQDIRIANNILIKNKQTHAVVFPMPSTIYYDMKKYLETNTFTPSGMSNFPFELENKEVINSIKKFKYNNIFPFAFFSLREIEKQIEFLQENKKIFMGLKFHSLSDQHSPKELLTKGKAFLEFAKANNLPILLHTGYNSMEDSLEALEVAKQYNTVRFCMAHCGGFKKEFFEQVKNLDNVFFDMSPFLQNCKTILHRKKEDQEDLPYNNPKKVFEYLMENFKDKLLWGSDSPWTTFYKDEKIIDFNDEYKFFKSLKKKHKYIIANKNSVKFLFNQ